MLQKLVFNIVMFQSSTTRSKDPTMADDQQFCLRWNDFQTNMVASFKHLRDEKSFCDVTIATEVLSLLFFSLSRMDMVNLLSVGSAH